MIEKFIIFLFGPKLTLLSGIFLAISLTMLLSKTQVFLDPAWASVMISGIPLCYYAFTSLFFYKKITSPLLISMAMIASISVGELFAAAEVAFIMALGAVLEERTVKKAKKGIKKLVSLIPQTARKIEYKASELLERILPIEEIQVGDRVKVLPGEVIPVDGTIVKGASSIDQSSMTGESLPVDKFEGDEVFAATINQFGTLEISTLKLSKDSTLQKFIYMSEEAENKKAPTQRIMDKWAAILVPTALSIAILTYIFTLDIIRAITVLIVFCPCALALATPTAIMAAIGQASKFGVLIKSGEALEKMGKISLVATDKTGTLTQGKLLVTDILTFSDEYSKEGLLQMAASVESSSEHPLAKSLLSYAKLKKIKILETFDFEISLGKGVSAKVDDKKIFCGGFEFLLEKLKKKEELELSLKNEYRDQIEKLKRTGKALIYVGTEENLLGLVALSDTLKSTAFKMVEDLTSMQTDIALLTGDNQEIALHFADKLGIKKVYANLLPDAKLHLVESFKAEGKNVCMIGDGINDTLALKAADVSLAMGTLGSDIAIDAADVALMGDDIGKVSYLKKLSLKTIRTIKQNIVFSMLVNFIAISLSVSGNLTPVLGALVHNASSFLVVLNAALLYDRKIS